MYVHTVDPNGPAAAVGLQVYIHVLYIDALHTIGITQDISWNILVFLCV